MNNQIILTKEQKIEKVAEMLKTNYPNGSNQIKEYLNALEVMGLIKNLEPNQIYHFLRVCIDYKLDPLKKEIYCIPYRNRDGTTTISIIISYMEYIKKAEQHPKYQVPSVTTYKVDSKGQALPPNQWYCVFEGKRKEDEVPFKRVFYMNEWNKANGEWGTKPIFMLEKTAMKNGLAWMYPDLKGYLTVEETIYRNGEILDIYQEEEQAPKQTKRTREISKQLYDQQPNDKEEKKKTYFKGLLEKREEQATIEYVMQQINWNASDNVEELTQQVEEAIESFKENQEILFGDIENE